MQEIRILPVRYVIFSMSGPYLLIYLIIQINRQEIVRNGVYTKRGHKLRFDFEQKTTIMDILTSIPVSSSLDLQRNAHDPDRVF